MKAPITKKNISKHNFAKTIMNLNSSQYLNKTVFRIGFDTHRCDLESD